MVNPALTVGLHEVRHGAILSSGRDDPASMAGVSEPAREFSPE
jgi:hypothetical protein